MSSGDFVEVTDTETGPPMYPTQESCAIQIPSAAPDTPYPDTQFHILIPDHFFQGHTVD